MDQKSQQAALEVLRAIQKSSNTALQLDDVPEEFLRGENILLGRWTMVVNDKNMKQLSQQPDGVFTIDCNKPRIEDFFWDFWNQKPGARVGVTKLEIQGAKEVSEYGLAVVARKNPNLQHLDISGCNQIGDVGLREIGMNCSKLSSLNMSTCHAVTGSGLIAIAECCPLLLKLDVSKCQNLQPFGLSKIFYGCRQLEELNFSNMNIVGDEEVRTLALNCPNVVYFNSPECTFISDGSLQVLAKNCLDLDYVDISRTSMSSRITDLTLLAFGQNSMSLRVLKLCGCEHLTDVGLMWLSEGCKVLEELDLNGCTKIGDAGIRSLSTCVALTSLDISNAKLVSDIGVANLSTGCPKIKHLVLKGLYLMCDPRMIVETKKGGRASSWQSIIGVQALSMYSHSLESLDLTGCFRLNISIQKFLNQVETLKRVNLSGCNQITTESLVSLSKGCTLLQDVTLNDAGLAVNNISIAAIARNCPYLINLVMCRCLEVRGGAMSALANCENLTKLDVTGCKSLTDMMMLPLTEVDKVMALKTLILLNCPLITDTTLAWFASKTQNIQLLACKGSSISKHSVQAVRDRFPNSDKLDNQNFLGFWPKFRIDDRKIMNKYFYAKQGWIKIQARQRSWLARQRVAVIVEKRRRKKAVAKLQRMCYWFVAINRMHYKRCAYKVQQRYAILITSVFYIAKARKRVYRRKQELHKSFLNKQATLIETHWRMHYAYKLRMQKLALYHEWLRKREYGTMKIQSIARVCFAKNRVLLIKKMRLARELLIERKSIVIQRCWRGGKGRTNAKERKAYIEWFTVRRHTAAEQIQRKARINYTNKLVKQRQDRKMLLYRSTTSIQSLMRGFMCRLVLAQEGAEEAEILQDSAATVIQSQWRVKGARLLIGRMKADYAAQEKRKERAAVVVQNSARAKLARRELTKKKEEYLMLLKARVDVELWGVCKIQALYRGMRGRVRFDKLVREKKGKWKELFDEEKQKRFFYNKLTGEIRWRMPQDLLDLIPRPKCDNCTFYEGILECSVCNEVYCQQCWDQVHFGGRRKDHEFRALYDFYNNRLDYGDGIFPSKWPSEIIQDEVQGWMLRVAPIRDPIQTYGNGWEEYNELEIDGSVGKPFFFNRETFEAAYDQPQEVVQYMHEQQAWAEYETQQAEEALKFNQQYSGFTAQGGGGAITGGYTSKNWGSGEEYGQQEAYSTNPPNPVLSSRSDLPSSRIPGTGRLSTVTKPPPPREAPPSSARSAIGKI